MCLTSKNKLNEKLIFLKKGKANSKYKMMYDKSKAYVSPPSTKI